jgi:polyhydroxybutyrate depolymerase
MPPGKTSRPLPLVISLQGKGQPLTSLRRWLRLAPVAGIEGFAIAYPIALSNQWSYGRPVAADMPTAGGQPADDAGFIRAIIDRLIADGTADAGRVYATGLSRGGLKTFTLAYAMPDRIAAFAPLITGMTEHQRTDCPKGPPRPMLVLAGTADLVQRYDGWLWPRGRLLSVPETMEFWRNRFGCTGLKANALPRMDPNDPTLGIGVVR